MISKKVTLLSAAVGAAFVGVFSLSAPAQAADGTITFNGKVTAATCTVQAGKGDLTVQMPTVSASAFKADGDVAGSKPFTISFSGCTGDASTVKVGFESGANVDPVTGRLKLNGADAAKNLQLGLYNDDSSNIRIGDSATVKGVSLASGSGTVLYMAKYVQTGATAVKAGNANTSVTYSLIYE